MTKPFEELTLSQVATYPRPGLEMPDRIGFTPDGRRVTFLWSEEGSLVRGLWAMDVDTGERTAIARAPEETADETKLSREERLRRERARLRETGITSYEFARESDPPVLVVPIAGRIHARVGGGELRPLPGTEGAVDPRVSRDGARVAFTRDGDLWVVDTDGGSPRRVTETPEDGVTSGAADFISHEELDQGRGFWWSRDGKWLAFLHVDARGVPVYPIVHQGTPEPEVEEHRYPFAGKTNADVALGIVRIEGGEIRRPDLGEYEYVARVAWRPDGRVAALVMNRAQTTARWIVVDPESGDAEPLLELHSEPWLNLNDDTRFLESGEMLFSAERTGFRHLYLLHPDRAEATALTDGQWMVTRLLDVDEARRVAYFEATRESALERHVHAVGLDGGEVRRLTRGRGWHTAILSPDHERYVLVESSLERGYRVSLVDVAGEEIAVIHEDPSATAEALGLTPPRLATFPGPDGTPLDAAVYEPPGGAAGAPVIVSVYGGPHAQRVANEWTLTVDLRSHYLARRGFLVLKVDNRGAANRGLAFEAALARRFGSVEVEDQLAGARWAVAEYGVDADRVGAIGWSYGGYMTLMLMLRHPEVFKVGVSGAPVTDWDGYDTGYTERYMGTPAENPEGYREGSVLPLADRLEGKLLLVHGMIDENVHFRHTARLLVALGKAGKTVDLLALPEERHMPREKAGLLDLERRITGYFEEHL